MKDIKSYRLKGYGEYSLKNHDSSTYNGAHSSSNVNTSGKITNIN